MTKYTNLEMTPRYFEAAMYAHLGHQCQLSKSGFEVIFAPDYRMNGRADLSGMATLASAQLVHAGIDPEGVTPTQEAEWLAWRGEQSRLHDQATARFVITSRFSEPYRGSEGSCGVFNRVKLIVGGVEKVSCRIECLERFDPEARDQLGRPGAIVHYPDAAAIDLVLREIKSSNPAFADAPITDNSGRRP